MFNGVLLVISSFFSGSKIETNTSMQVQASVCAHFPNEQPMKSRHSGTCSIADSAIIVACPLEAWLPLEAQYAGLAPLHASMRLADAAARASLRKNPEEFLASDGVFRDDDGSREGEEEGGKEESCTQELCRLVAALLADTPSSFLSAGSSAVTLTDDSNGTVVSSPSTSSLAPPPAEALLPLALPLLLPRLHTLLREIEARARADAAACAATSSKNIAVDGAAARALACAIAPIIGNMCIIGSGMANAATGNVASGDTSSGVGAASSNNSAAAMSGAVAPVDSTTAQVAWERKALRTISLLEALGGKLSLSTLAVLLGVPYIDARSAYGRSCCSSSGYSGDTTSDFGSSGSSSAWLWPLPAKAGLGHHTHRWSHYLAAAVARLLAPDDAS